MNSLRQLQETDPTVSVEIDVAHRLSPGQTLYFDYDAYQTSVDTLAGQPHDVSGVDIMLSADGPDGMAGLQSGDSISILVNPTDLTIANELTLHESQHLIDYHGGYQKSRLGRLTYRAAVDIVRRKVPLVASSALVYSGSAVAVAAGVDNKYLEALNDNPAMPYIMPTAVALAGLRYYLDPAERRARKAEKLSAAPVISVR